MKAIILATLLLLSNNLFSQTYYPSTNVPSPSGYSWIGNKLVATSGGGSPAFALAPAIMSMALGAYCYSMDYKTTGSILMGVGALTTAVTIKVMIDQKKRNKKTQF